MKVKDLINQLNEIGYDEETELTFSCVDGTTGEYHVIPFEGITYGESLTGQPYHNDAIDVGLDVDSCEAYIKSKTNEVVEKITEDVNIVLSKYDY